MKVIREIMKLVMFTQLWALPLVTAKLFGTTSYLWLFVVSALGTLAVFTHYEDLENPRQNKNQDEA